MLEHMEAADALEPVAIRPPYRVKEVAQILGVSLATVYEEIASGRLPALAIGGGSGTKRVEYADLEAYKALCRSKAIRTPTSNAA
jgi:excisionase family DNA binding protein